MDQTKIISNSVKTTFYLNLFNFIIFIIIGITGVLLQIEYHMNGHPEEYFVLGLNKYGWLLVHKILSVLSFTGIATHCIMHWKFIVATTKKILDRNTKSKIILSYYLFILYITTSLIGLLSWIFLDYGDHTRFMLMEIHDKLTLLLIVLTIIHIISRTRWMIRTYPKLKMPDNS